MRPWWKKKRFILPLLSQGQPVTVTGTITDVGELLGYVLEAETIT